MHAGHVLIWERGSFKPATWLCDYYLKGAEVGVSQATSPGTCRPRARRKTVLLLLVSGPGFQGLDVSPPDPCYRLAPPVERLSGPTSPAFCFMEEDVSS